MKLKHSSNSFLHEKSDEAYKILDENNRVTKEMKALGISANRACAITDGMIVFH